MSTSKGIVYFRDGHVESIRSYYENEDHDIVFHTESGAYIYRKELIRMETGYLCVRHKFKKWLTQYNQADPLIERIVLV